MNKLLALLLFPLPSIIKVFVLRKLGHPVHKTAYIGLSFLNIDQIKMGENTYIGMGNIFTNLESLVLDEGSRINRWNRFTSGKVFHGKLRLQRHASISLRHYFDICDVVDIGPNTIVAGHRSSFFTHSKGIHDIDYVKPITVGEMCYLGSNLCVAPGAKIAHHTFIGMGAVVAGDMSKYSYVLLVGNPARPKKTLPENAAYFQQGDIIHPHIRNKAI